MDAAAVAGIVAPVAAFLAGSLWSARADAAELRPPGEWVVAHARALFAEATVEGGTVSGRLGAHAVKLWAGQEGRVKVAVPALDAEELSIDEVVPEDEDTPRAFERRYVVGGAADALSERTREDLLALATARDATSALRVRVADGVAMVEARGGDDARRLQRILRVAVTIASAAGRSPTGAGYRDAPRTRAEPDVAHASGRPPWTGRDWICAFARRTLSGRLAPLILLVLPFSAFASYSLQALGFSTAADGFVAQAWTKEGNADPDRHYVRVALGAQHDRDVFMLTEPCSRACGEGEHFVKPASSLRVECGGRTCNDGRNVLVALVIVAVTTIVALLIGLG
jgi:hypothetical protein